MLMILGGTDITTLATVVGAGLRPGTIFNQAR